MHQFRISLHDRLLASLLPGLLFTSVFCSDVSNTRLIFSITNGVRVTMVFVNEEIVITRQSEHDMAGKWRE